MADEVTWKQLRDRARRTPEKLSLDLAVLHRSEKPYEAFVQLVHRSIQWSAQEMARNKNIAKGMSEDQLTTLLLAPLLGVGFIAYHDVNIGGHCDIYIEFDDGLLWLGEAKKHTSYGTLYGGFQQLADRYSTGLSDQDSGGFIIYITNKNAAAVMTEWIDYLGSNFAGIHCSYDAGSMLGHSTHPHSGSGRPMHVEHFPVVLHHDPTDTSAPPARKRK